MNVRTWHEAADPAPAGAGKNGGLWVQSPELELRNLPGDTPNRLRNARAKELSES
jgi:hypothetical protein